MSDSLQPHGLQPTREATALILNRLFQEKLRNRQIRSGSPGMNKIHHLEKMEEDITVEDTGDKGTRLIH